MPSTFRIHGDNIIECERIAKTIISSLQAPTITTRLIAPSTISITIQALYQDIPINWELILLPGFNKNNRRRWEANIFDALKEAGSYFDETPDAIISKINDNNTESILVCIEFCSALQAGNQAWQRSARAFSTSRTGCPYLYIVDFVKYELDNLTRERKNLRFPNAAVPYSYINYAKTNNTFVAQLYVKSEEFDRTKDYVISDFDESNFGNDILGTYIIKLMLNLDTSHEERIILQKNMNVVVFLANKFKQNINFTECDWQNLYNTPQYDIINYSVEMNRFSFHKSIAQKSQHGKSSDVIRLLDKLSVGLASRDLPLGIIPAEARNIFANHLYNLYPGTDIDLINNLSKTDKHLVVAVMKGFKPRGDDNRPDRGLLPFATMLSSEDTDIMTFIYGPVLAQNLELLNRNPTKLAKKNGFWRSILALSDYILLDVPVIRGNITEAKCFYNNKDTKAYFRNAYINCSLQPNNTFSNNSVRFGEDDVDTAIHYFFSHILKKYCFEGMCNPPGGDWSGFSVIANNMENRWLSLPRESKIINGKRPDHILELFGVFHRPLLLSIESKERSIDLEEDVGTKLIRYIEELMRFTPSAVRQCHLGTSPWSWGEEIVPFNLFESMSAAAYLKQFAESPELVFAKNCEILFVLTPIQLDFASGWEMEIVTSSPRSELLKQFIIQKYAETGDNQYIIK